MNMIKKAIVLAVLATSAFGAQSAFAGVLPATPAASHLPSFSSLSDGLGGFSATYGDSFNAGAANTTFDDGFTFTIGASSATDASVTTSIPTVSKGLDITLFQIVKYDTSGTLATYSSTGTDLMATLGAGTYYLEVAGAVTGSKGGSFGGNLDVVVTAVPEPETYAMLFAGLGLMGFMVRRNKKQA